MASVLAKAVDLTDSKRNLDLMRRSFGRVKIEVRVLTKYHLHDNEPSWLVECRTAF